MKCSQVQEKLSLFIDGLLDEYTLEAIEAHLETCEECREELKALQDIVSLTSELSEIEPPVYLSSAIKNAVAAGSENASACDWCCSVLSEYVDAELTISEMEKVEAHTASCAHCAGALAAVRATVGAIAMVAEVEPPANLRSRIAAATTGSVRVPVLSVIKNGLNSVFGKQRLGWATGLAAATVVGFFAISSIEPAKTPKSLAKKDVPQVVAETPKVIEQPSAESQEIKTAKPLTANVQLVRPRVKIAKIEKPAQKQQQHKAVVVAKTSTTTMHTLTRTALKTKPVDTKPVVTASVATHDPKEPVEVIPATASVQESPSTVKVRVVEAARTARLKTEDLDSYFKDAKTYGDFKRRSDDKIRVDVISKRF